jgi:hypothetical protein
VEFSIIIPLQKFYVDCPFGRASIFFLLAIVVVVVLVGKI